MRTQQQSPFSASFIMKSFTLFWLLFSSGWVRLFAETRGADSSAFDYLDAITDQDTVKLRALLREDRNMCAAVNYTLPGLHVAAHQGFVEGIRVFIEEGAHIEEMLSVQSSDEILISPLTFAIQGNQTGSIQELIRLGANVHHRPFMNEDASLLHLIVKNGFAHLIKIMVDAGINLERKNSDGHTALATAVIYEQIPSAINLIKLGADVNRPCYSSGEQTTLLGHATALRQTKLVKALVKYGALVNAPVILKNNKTALFYTILSKNYEIAEILLNAGANPNFVALDNSTPIMTALEKKAENRMIELLVRFGADINLETNSITPLLYVTMRRPEQIPFLLRLGAKIENDHSSALFFAAKVGALEAIDLFLAQGVSEKSIITSLKLTDNSQVKQKLQKALDQFAPLPVTPKRVNRTPTLFELGVLLAKRFSTLSGFAILILMPLYFLLQRLKVFKLKLEQVQQLRVDQEANRKRKLQLILNSLNEMVEVFYQDAKWVLTDNQQFSLAVFKRGLSVQLIDPTNQQDDLALAAIWPVFMNQLQKLSLESNDLDLNSQQILLTLDNPIQSKQIAGLIKNDLIELWHATPSYKAKLLLKLVENHCQEVSKHHQRLSTLITTAENEKRNFIRNKDEQIARALRRLAGLNEQEIPSIKKGLDALHGLGVVFDTISNVQSEFKKLEKNAGDLLEKMKRDVDLAPDQQMHSVQLLAYQTWENKLTEVELKLANYPKQFKELFTKLENAVSTYMQEQQQINDSLTRSQQSSTRQQQQLENKKLMRLQQLEQEQKIREENKAVWEKKQEEERAARLLLQQEEKEREASASSSATQSISKFFPARNPQLQQAIIAIGDVLQHMKQDSDPHRLEYKYVLLVETLRLFELMKQSHQHPVVKQIRNALMHNHRYIDIESLANFAEFIAHLPAGEKENVYKLEDALRSNNETLYSQRLLQAVRTLKTTPLYLTQARCETELASARVYVETIDYLLEDLNRIPLKEGVSLEHSPYKIRAILGIMMCVGECQQRLRNEFESREPFVRKFIAAKKRSDLLTGFINRSVRVREALGHKQIETSEEIIILQQYKQKAELMREGLPTPTPTATSSTIFGPKSS